MKPVRMLACAALLATAIDHRAAVASPAPINITIDRVVGNTAGWSIGYSNSLGGCLAAAKFGDSTTIWFGFSSVHSATYLAFTNPNWRSIESGEQYDLRLVARGKGNWQGTFTGFERDGAKGLFQVGLKDKFISDLSSAGGISVVFRQRQIASLSLVGSTEALEAVLTCQKGAGTTATRSEGSDSSKPRKREPGSSSSGTGFYVSERGHVMTNHHVIDGCTDYRVKRPGLPPLVARLVASDATNDLAVLSTDSPNSNVPALSVRARVGESVYVYGFPQSDVLASTGNFTVGNVTATAGVRDDTRMIQISAPVHMGNSGGPVLDQFGNVIGVIRSKATVLASNDVAQNVNFAIKTTVALNFLDANGIEASLSSRKSDAMDGATIAEKAREFTVQVVCN